jgi:deoxycytidylate deaminase
MLRKPQDYLLMAYQYARTHSDDISTHNGAVLVDEDRGVVLMLGANRLPRGVRNTPDRHERPKKYAFMEHAERNVILACARRGIKTEGTTLYVPWFSCADCARAIIGAGIRKVVGHKQMFDKTPERWRESIADGNAMLDEAGIIREYYDGVVGCEFPVLFDGAFWHP